MNLGLSTLAANLGVSFESIILIIFLAGSLIFFAKDVRLGLVLLFFGSAGIFAWFYVAGYNYVPILVIMFMSLILLAFTLYSKSTNPYGGVT
jgi:hypothetical protein